MYHRNKVHTDEFWKYEMAKHRRTVVDDKDRNDDMWQQQLGKHGTEIANTSKSSGQNGSGYGGETMTLNKTDPSHDERWLQQIKRATSKETNKDAKQPLTDEKLLALQSLQSSLHTLKDNVFTNGNETVEDRGHAHGQESNALTPRPLFMPIKEENMYIDKNYASNKLSDHVKSQLYGESRFSNAINKASTEQHDNYLTLLAHISTQRKAREEQGPAIQTRNETAMDFSLDESIVSRGKSNNLYQEQSERSESLCSRQRAVAQDQRSSSNSPPTLSLPDVKEESSVTRTKMWLAQLGQYRQKAVQEEMEKSHDELWEEQISRAKSSPSKSTNEPLEVTIEDEVRSAKHSTSSVSTPRFSVQSKQEKHPPLISALQVQPAPNRANPQISTPKLTRKSHDNERVINERLNNNSPSLSQRSSIEKMSPPLPPASPITSEPRSKDSGSVKNLLSINPSIIVNINGQNVNMRGTDTNGDKIEKPLSLKSFNGQISLLAPNEANNNEPLVHEGVTERQHNSDDITVHQRHIPLALPPLQPSAHLPPIAKYKSEKLPNLNQENVNGKNCRDTESMKMVDENPKSKPKYPPPDPNSFGSSSVLKMLLTDPSSRKRTLSPPPSPIQNKRSANVISNKLLEPQQKNSENEKSMEKTNVFKKFYGAPNTSDDTDILRRRLLGIRDSTPQTVPQNKSVNMLMPKPKYSPPSATITSADVAREEPNLFPKKTPMAVEEFSKVAAAAATLASFNLSRLDEKQLTQQNLEINRMTKKVNFPIEVNYETYNQQESYQAPQRYQFFFPTTQQQPKLLLEDDLKNSTNGVPSPEPIRKEGNNSTPYRKSKDSDHNDPNERRNKDCVEDANISAYARTSVSKQLLHRYTTHNNNNNSNDDTHYNSVRRTSQ